MSTHVTVGHDVLTKVPEATARQLDYWARLGYLRPERDGEGSGYPRRWPPREVAVARTMARLVAAGLALDVAAKAARGDREIGPGVWVRVSRIRREAS